MESDERQILLKALELQWEDHFHTRTQTWESLKMGAILAVALVGLDWKVDKPIATVVAAGLLILITIFGMQITVRHRNNVEVVKFRRIRELEEQLGIAAGSHKTPDEIRWWYVFLVNRANTSLFILRMHFVILLFALAFMLLRLWPLMLR